MNIKLTLAQKDDGSLILRTKGRTCKVCTVSETAHILKRTRRQVYRYIVCGALEPEVKILGEWLLDVSDVKKFALVPLSVQPLPKKLKSLFPEYDISKINAGRDRTLIISRVLENGGTDEIKWLFSRYSHSELADFLEKDGARLLNSRSLRLWSLVLGVKPKPPLKWRETGLWKK
jgi:hypothetical protein